MQLVGQVSPTNKSFLNCTHFVAGGFLFLFFFISAFPPFLVDSSFRVFRERATEEKHSDGYLYVLFCSVGQRVTLTERK